MSPLRAFEEAACEAAHRAGALLKRRFRDPGRPAVEAKGLHDFVTEVDREAEALVVDHLRAQFPEHGIMAEEGSPEVEAGGYRWIVDPLDGTTNFLHGVPTFAVSIALEDDSGLLAAAVHDPIHDETFHASRGRGARLDGEAIHCSPANGLEASLIATGFPFRDYSKIRAYMRALESFMKTTAGLRRAGAASLDLAFAACGRYDGFWEFGLKPWDLAAGALLILEAGGVVTDPVGGDGFLRSGDIVAAGPGLHDAVLAVTRSALGKEG